NSSNNGRLLQAMLNRVYMECNAPDSGRQVILLGGFAPFELSSRKAINIGDLCTSYGRLNLTYSNDFLELQFEKELAPDILFRLPAEFMPCEPEAFAAAGSGLWRLHQQQRYFSFAKE
ncbi:MAG: hypothetical protein GX564_08350, partial [Oligosphaeraceae bacterium]|nr:hypothetical protein [Oligosphaeraceae bacterium]